MAPKLPTSSRPGEAVALLDDPRAARRRPDARRNVAKGIRHRPALLMRILKSRIALLALSCLASLILAELFCEFYLPERSDTFIVNLLNYRQKYHHDLKLKETLHAPRAEAFRVMFLGDSFTWGPASPEDSFPHQVEEMFQKGTVLGVPKLDVQSFNLGMASYSPSIYGVVLRDYAPELKPHLVVVSVDDSDLQDDLVYSAMVVRDGASSEAHPGGAAQTGPTRPETHDQPVFALPPGTHQRVGA